jgi:hypothetical protein
MLQMAGGEPVDKSGASNAVGERVAPEERGTGKVDVPVSAADRRAASFEVDGQAKTQPVDTAASLLPSTGRTTLAEPFERMEAMPPIIEPTAVGFVASLTVAADSAVARAQSGAQGTRFAALDEAFDGLSDGGDVANLKHADRLAWRDTFGAAPLLLMLALERIATSSSRRANRECSVQISKQSRRRPEPVRLT